MSNEVINGMVETMSDLIDRDALLEQIDIDSDGNEGQYGDEWFFIKTIENAPTIDAVEVVRCKNCKHGKYEFTDNKDWIYCKYHYDYWTADDFCSYGERKDHE